MYYTSQIVGLTMWPYIDGVAATSAAAFDSLDGILERNGCGSRVGFGGEAYLRSCSNVPLADFAKEKNKHFSLKDCCKEIGEKNPAIRHFYQQTGSMIFRKIKKTEIS